MHAHWSRLSTIIRCRCHHTARIICECVCRYGPETYNLKRVVAGKYVIKANYFGSHQQKLFGPATMKATVFSNYGQTFVIVILVCCLTCVLCT